MAALVIAYHYTTRYGQVYGHNNLDVGVPAECATYAVSVFLVMMGYFSYNSLHSDNSVLAFIKKRVLKLLPAYWSALIITTIALNLTGVEHVSLVRFLANAIFVNRFFGIPFIDGAHWYMIILIVFTSFVVFCLLFNEKYREKIIICYTVVFAVVGIVNQQIQIVPEIIAFLIFNYINKCLVGYWIVAYHKSGKMICLANIIVLSVFEFFWNYTYVAIPDILAIMTVWLISNRRIKVELRQPWETVVPVIGELSYFIYLVHQKLGFVIIGFAERWQSNDMLAILCALIIVLLISTLYYVISQYISRKIKTKISSQKRDPIL